MIPLRIYNQEVKTPLVMRGSFVTFALLSVDSLVYASLGSANSPCLRPQGVTFESGANKKIKIINIHDFLVPLIGLHEV